MNDQVNVDFGGWIQKGIDVWKENILTLCVAYILFVFISAFSFGILAGPMWAGYYGMTLALHDKSQPKPQISDLFKGFSMFLPSFLLVLLMMAGMFIIFLFCVIPCIGWILGPVLSFAYSALLMFAMFNIVDKKLPVIDSIKASVAKVRGNFFPFLGFFVVAIAIGGAGTLLCGVGNFVTMPIAFCILTAAYRACHGESAETPVATPPALP